MSDSVVVFRRPGQDCPNIVPLRLMDLVADVTPGVLLLELLEADRVPSLMATNGCDVGLDDRGWQRAGGDRSTLDRRLGWRSPALTVQTLE
jgi:hypothetical protein